MISPLFAYHHVVFKEEPLNLKEGDVLEIEGQVTNYKDKLEIIAKKITIL